MNTLKDIKANVVVPDDSLIYLLILVILISLLLLFLGYRIWQKMRLKHRKDKRRQALKKLKHLDFNDSKDTAYTFSRYACLLVQDENIAEFQKINDALIAYKYKQQVDSLDASLIEKIQRFINV